MTANNLGIIQWFVVASYAIHNDCRGHTGLMFTMGTGAVTSFSWKQKLNAKSSTEGELIGVNDALPQILWSRYFMKSEGYKVKENIIFQDNKSTLILEKNGKALSSKKTKHIKVRYFFYQRQD